MKFHEWDTNYDPKTGHSVCSVCGQTTRACMALCPGVQMKTPLIQAVEEFHHGREKANTSSSEIEGKCFQDMRDAGS